MKEYFNRLLTALSILLNVVFDGDLAQTFSARMWQRKKDKKLNIVFIIDAILGSDHCAKEWALWKVRKW